MDLTILWEGGEGQFIRKIDFPVLSTMKSGSKKISKQLVLEVNNRYFRHGAGLGKIIKVPESFDVLWHFLRKRL